MLWKPTSCVGAEPPIAAKIDGLPDDLPVTRTKDVIYGRKHGMALTMDVFTPTENANGAAVVLVLSGGWVSSSPMLNGLLIGHFLPTLIERGYTVFAVVHGSQPKFKIPDAVADLNRAVRYIRHHAEEFGIDPQQIGITGGSAGGHLSLMQGTAGNEGDATADDPVERESSRVQAVACLFPPTDFLNYGGSGKFAFDRKELLAMLRVAVPFSGPNAGSNGDGGLTEDELRELAVRISPVTHVTADDPPTLIVHGDADLLVPHQQSELIMAKFKDAGLTAELITRAGRGHDFEGVDADVAAIADWFDKHLKNRE